MNERLVQFARAELKSGLAQLPDGWKMNFKRMYGDGDLDLELDDIVDGIPEEKLDWAMSQVQNSIKKLKALSEQAGA